jgi:hypothetical protein
MPNVRRKSAVESGTATAKIPRPTYRESTSWSGARLVVECRGGFAIRPGIGEYWGSWPVSEPASK